MELFAGPIEPTLFACIERFIALKFFGLKMGQILSFGLIFGLG